MNELEQIVQRMIDAGESEEAIALVIKEYNSDKSTEEGKTSTTELDTTVGVTEVSDTESLSEDGSLELEETKPKKEEVYPGIVDIGDFFGDLYRAGEQGFEQAKAVDPSIDIYRAGSETSDEQILKWIDTNKGIAENTKESEEMQSFNKIYEENGGSWWGFVKGVANNPSTLPAMLVSSMATQLGSLQSEEVLAAGTAAGITGATGGAFIGGIGALPGGLAGAMSGTMTAMETGLTFSELLTEEVGEDLSVEKVRKVLENPEKLAELKNKALGRGVAIGAIELATMGLAKGVGGKIAKAGFKGAKPTGLAAAGAVEVVGGGTGEVAGRFVADQEMDVAEIGFEAFAGLGSAPVTMASQLKDLGRNVDVANLNKFLKEANYKEVTEAFSPEVKTSEAQVKIAKTPNAVDVIDKKLKQEVIAGTKTPEEADAIALNFRETQGAVNQIKPLRLSTKDEATAVQLMKEKKQLSNEIKQVGEPNLTIEQSNRIKQIDEDLKGIGSKAVTQEVEKVKKAAESIKDLDVQEFASTQETEAFLSEQGQNTKASGQQGFIIQDPNTGKQTIVINREIADKEIAVAAPSHEFLHALLFQTVKNSPETQVALGNSLKEYINKIDANKVQDSNFAKRLEQYKSDPEAVQAEEVLTLFSDAIRTEDIKFNETVFTKIGDVVRKALQALGVKVKFNNGKDVYNFIKDYNKSLESTGLTKAQIKAAEGVTGKLVADKVQTDEQIIKESRSEEASARVQELYDTQGEAATFDIIEQFKPITSKIVEKRSEAPGFDRQLLTDEIETGKRGILDLVREYDPESGVPLAAYINKFLPARAIEASKRILGEEFTEDVAEAKGVAAEEASIEVAKTEKQATSKLRRVLGIKQGDDIYNLAKEVSGEILSGDLPGKKVKTAINREARKSKLRKAVSDLMGTEKAIDEQFLNKNILEILKALPASDLVKLEREAKVKVLAEQGPRLNVKDAREAVNKGLLPKDTNLQSGPKVSSKLPTTLEQAKEFFTQKRKAGLVNVVTEMLVKDAAPEVTEGKMEPAKRAKVLSEIDRAPILKFSQTAETALDRPLFELEEKVVDELLEKYNQRKTFKYKTKEQVDEVVEEIKNNLLPLMPKDFWFGKPDSKGNYGTAFTPSSKIFGTNEMSKDLYKNYWTKKVKELRNLPDSAFGKKIKGIEDFSKSSYSTLFKDEATIKKNIKNGKVDEFNNKVSKIHEALWRRIHNEIQSNPKSATVISNYLKMVGSDTSHWHKLGAKFVGYSKNPSGRYEYEHAMPATAAYLYLLDASLSGANFNVAYAAVMDNYKLIALDKVMDKKLTAVGLQRKMPKGWKLLDNFWWQRYFNKEVAAIDGGIPTNSLIFLNGKDATQELKVDSAGNATTPAIQKSVSKASKSNNDKSAFKFSKTPTNKVTIDTAARTDKALDNARDLNAPVKKIRVFDFDDTLARTKSDVLYTMPNPSGKPSAEKKVVFLVGAAGSGKSTLTKQLSFKEQGFTVINRDTELERLTKEAGLPTDMRKFTPKQRDQWREMQYKAAEKSTDDIAALRSKGKGVVIDEAGSSEASIMRNLREFKKAGYDVQMVFTESSLDTALERNKNRTERSLTDTTVKNSFEAVMKNKKRFSEMFKENFVEVNTDKLGINEMPSPSITSKINQFTKGFIKGKLNAEQFASEGSTLLSEGAVFDFSEFNKVTEGKKGPLFKVAQTIAAKRGTEDVFVLTARAPESQLAIYEFLKSQGLNIPLKNITGLGDSTGDAKARWIVDKAADGYNDFYFADDAFQNVKAVKDALSVLDVKSKTQQAKIKFSKSLDLNKDFNDIIENKTGIASDKTYARVKAEVAGANKGKFNFFIPPSAEDFVGLLYSTLGKGSTGDAQMAWYKAHLLNPFARAMENIANDRVAMIQDYKGLKKALKIVPKDLRKKVPGEPFTREQAVRVYIWDKQGMEIPGLSKKDQSDLVKYVNDSTELTAFADQLIAINKGDEYASPDAGWVAGTIDTDFLKALNTTKRAKYLEVWQQNVDEIFSETNLNKLEAAYGKPYRVAMENILHRMKTGRNRSFGTDTITGRFTDWLTNSVGAIMFFNTRSAVLQTISAVNFINFSDNNVLRAGKAFANQPQYWSDFKKLFNSPFLLDRRSGIKLNVNEADIAEMAKGPGNSARNVIAGLLKAGFLPTQLADSFAIASGGATFYRNRIKALKKEGLTEAEAEEIAFRDFREIAEESQQSSRPDKISQQQAGPLGRVVLAFANTPAQYARLIKKAASDLKNGRGDAKTNISKIIYYGVAQNVLFSALQQALFAVSFGDDEEEEKKRDEKYFNIANGMADSILRGIGVGGAIASVVKNTAIKLAKEEEKRSPKYQDVLVKEVLQISPPISSKVGKLRSAGRSLSWNKKEMMTKGWSIDNPAYLASANVISAVTNLPADRAVKKITNLVDASNEEIEYYKRIALALGWSSWELGIDKKDKKKPESSTGKTRTRTSRQTRTKKRRN